MVISDAESEKKWPPGERFKVNILHGFIVGNLYGIKLDALSPEDGTHLTESRRAVMPCGKQSPPQFKTHPINCHFLVRDTTLANSVYWMHVTFIMLTLCNRSDREKTHRSPDRCDLPTLHTFQLAFVSVQQK